MIYADTSVLVSLYMLDANTPRAVPLIRSLTPPLVYSALHRLEIQNAFSLAVFRGHQIPAQADAAWKNLEADLRAGLLVPTSIGWHAGLRRAAAIATSEVPTLGARSFDILHVACAMQLGATEFLTFDQRQHSLATRMGFIVRP